MPKRKILPDHSNIIEAIDLKTEIDQKECEKIKNKFTFDEEFNLHQYLLDAILWYETNKYLLSKRSDKEQAILLEELGKRSNSLLECFDKFGFEERGKIIDKFGPSLDINEIRYKLNFLAIAAPILAKEIQTNIPPGRKPNTPLKNFVLRLATIYQLGTKFKPTCNYNEVDSQYSGDFVEFTTQVLEEIGENRTNCSIGQLINEVLKYNT